MEQTGRVIGCIDLGSNSVRLLLARVAENGTATVLNQVKHMVRLGEGGFTHNHLQEASMNRTLNVLQGLAEMCAVYGADEIIAIATAAVRDAENGTEFMHRVHERTGIAFTVVSGLEEARLIYLGVSSGLPRISGLRLFVDVGGGSTELIVGSSEGHISLDSMKLGCVRLTDQFFGDGKKRVSAEKYAELQRFIRNEALHPFSRIAGYEIEEAVASSGSAQNLAEMAAALERAEGRSGNPAVLSYAGLCKVVDSLCRHTAEERRSLPGINPRRVDVLLAGAAILQTLMEEQGFDSLSISSRNLQNGILIDYQMRHFSGVSPLTPPRAHSILRMARFYHFEEAHSRHVRALALELLDSARSLGLHKAGPESRELLGYAALLHDIGISIAFSRHHAHSYYLIRNTELLGFTQNEITMIAALTFFHRKRPSKKYQEFLELEPEARSSVRLLALFLSLAEKLDKTHCALVRKARFARGRAGLELQLATQGDCPMEVGEAGGVRKQIRRLFGQECLVVVEALPVRG